MIQKSNIGFNFFETRNLNDTFKTRDFEDKIGFNLPPLYKVFLETFYIGCCIRPNGKYSNDYKFEEYYFKEYDTYSRAHYIENKIYNYDIMFYNIDDSLDYLTECKDDVEMFFESGVFDALPIGIGGNVGSPILFVGIKEYNLDKIYEVNTDLRKSVWTLLANNIFEFVRGFEMVEYTEEECKRHKFTYDKLYRNWGEDFWRVREENNENKQS